MILRTPAIQTGHSQLQRLVTLRAIAVVAQGITLALVYHFLAMQLEWLPLLAIIAAQGVFNLFTWWRLRSDAPVSNPEFFGQLSADVLALCLLFYFTGGSTNPFISLFLLPLVIAAATLPRGYTWAMAAMTTACYSLLMKFYIPLPVAQHLGHAGHLQHDMPQDEVFSFHIVGMWMGFVISTIVVAYFVVRMAYSVRERDIRLARVREETLRNERIVALGLQAASAAHEMGTPLSTMAVVIGELKRDQAVLPEWQGNLSVLDDQVMACKRILDKMLANAQDADVYSRLSLQQFLAETLDEWQLLRPTVKCRYMPTDIQTLNKVHIDPALRAALLNLLNNAADASPDEILVEAHLEERNFILRIHDQGSGLTPDTAINAGSAFFTTKEEGHGLGLLLANATIERMGGKVRLFNRESGGATTEITLPFPFLMP